MIGPFKTVSAAGLFCMMACTVPTVVHANDGVHAMCLELGSEENCVCASESLEAEIGAENYAIYESVGADYMERRAGGEPRSAAWTAASEAVAARLGISGSELMKRTNVMGRAHREAIDACGG